MKFWGVTVLAAFVVGLAVWKLLIIATLVGGAVGFFIARKLLR